MASINLIIAEVLDITCMRHDTFKLDMDWEDASDNAIDLTGYTFKMQVRKKADSSSATLTFDDSDFTKDANGNLLVTKAGSSMTLKAGNYRYDLQATNTGTSEVSTWLNGAFVVKDDVTE